jgi:hypothetical protein
MDVFKVTTETSDFLVGAGSLAEVVEAYSDCRLLEIRCLGTLVPLRPKACVNSKYKQDPGMVNESITDMIEKLEADLADACRRSRSRKNA